MSDLNQLLFKFNQKKNFNYDDFYVGKSNFYAFKLIEKWPNWEKNIINICGEKFSGKTHLTNIFLKKNKGKKINASELDNNKLKEFKIYENIIIDDFDKFSDENLLYSLFNLVDSDNKYLIINSIKPISQINFKLNDLKSRSKNCIIAKIDSPDDDFI